MLFSLKIVPLVGSMRRLIIFSVVVGYEVIRRIRAADEVRAAAAALAGAPREEAAA